MKYEFMGKYGNKVREKYDLPTEEEIEAMKVNSIYPDTGLELDSDSDSDTNNRILH